MRRVRATFICCLIASLGATIYFWTMSSSRNLSTLFREDKTEQPNRSIWSHNISTSYMSHTDTNGSLTFNSDDEMANHQNLKDGTSRSTCPDILSGMTNGHWIQRALTSDEKKTIDTYLQESRGAFRIPSSFQRDDGLCGDVPYKDSPLYRHMWFRSICDPKGLTPCCQTNKCVALSEEQCRCPTCYDERQSIHAEYAQWKPEDDRCEVNNFTKDGACKVLNGTTLHFVGDSFIRHVFAALVVVLTNAVDGALKASTNAGQRHVCRGWHQVTGLTCRDHLDDDRSLCNGTVKVKYTQVFPSGQFSLTPQLLRDLRHVNKSIMVLGLGIHDNFNVTSVSNTFLLPFLNLHQLLSSDLTHDVKLEDVKMHFDDVDTSFSTTNKNDVTSNKPIDNNVYKITSASYENMTSQTWSTFKSNSTLNDHNTPQSSSKHGFRLANILKFFFQIGSTGNEEDNSSKNEPVNNPDKINLLPPLKASENVDHRSLTTQSTIKHEGVNSSSFILNIQQNSAKNLLNVTNSTITFRSYPTSDLGRRLFPRVLWIGTHSPGLLKSQKFQEQSADGVRSFNAGIRTILDRWKVPYLDTFGFTNGTVSHDGTHYGWGVNVLKVNMLLTLIHNEGWDSF